ncbi:MAG: ferric reductase-like transmembrane domain-containing protein [Actinomycetota bacterium]
MTKQRRRKVAPEDLGAPDLPRTTRQSFIRNAGVLILSAVLFAIFWFGRMDWDPEMRLWRAFGDVSILLLFGSLVLGPLAKLSRAWARLLPWRRELGVWCAVTAVVHAILVLVGWVEWDFGRLFGYEFIPELGRTARLEPGFGLANLVGLVAVVWALVLGITSSNRAVRFLGSPAWKWLHNGAYVLFYLAVLHTAYFLFMHYTLSFHREVPPPNWFRWPLVALGAVVLVLQYSAFVKTANRRRRHRTA